MISCHITDYTRFVIMHSKCCWLDITNIVTLEIVKDFQVCIPNVVSQNSSAQTHLVYWLGVAHATNDVELHGFCCYSKVGLNTCLTILFFLWNGKQHRSPCRATEQRQNTKLLHQTRFSFTTSFLLGSIDFVRMQVTVFSNTLPTLETPHYTWKILWTM